MRPRNLLTLPLCLASVILLAGITAEGQKVETGYDKAADFAQYKTYAWVERHVPPPNPLLAAIITNNIEVELNQKGLHRVRTNPDLLVSFYGGSSAQGAFAPGDPGYAASGGGPLPGATMWSGSAPATAMPQLLKGTLAVDLVDAHQKRLVWRGVAKTNLAYDDHSKMLDQVNKAVSAMFKKYPPEE
jgi:Domain of unknown function (DUF4136)